MLSRRFLCSACTCNCTSLLLKKRCCCETAVEREVTHGPCMPTRGARRHRKVGLQRNSDGPRFYIRTEGSGAFLFRASGRHPNVRVSLVDALFPGRLTTRTDGLTKPQLHVSRMLRTIWLSLRLTCCLILNSQKGAHRSCVAAFFPPPSGGHRSITLRTHLTC